MHLAAAAIFALVLTAGCTVHIGGEQDDDGAPVFGGGNSLEWDLIRPHEAEALGLPGDDMVVVTVPDDATASLTLPTGTWSGRTEASRVAEWTETAAWAESDVVETAG